MHGVLAPRYMKKIPRLPLLIISNQISNRQLPPRRVLTVSLSSSNTSPILKQAVIGISAAAALAGAAFVLVRKSSQQRRDQRNDPPQKESTRNSSNSSASTSAFYSLEQQHQYQQQYTSNTGSPRWMQLGWKRSTDAELAFIEAKRAREAAHELESWDRRWKLRKKTLTELRQMAAYVLLNLKLQLF